MPRHYSHGELLNMHSEAQTYFYHQGLSRREAYQQATEYVMQQTGQSHRSSATGYGRDAYATEEREPSRYSGRETPFERSYHNSSIYQDPRRSSSHHRQPSRSAYGVMDNSNDADYGHGEFSSHKYTSEQLKSMATDIFETWTRQGVHPEEARQEAEEFYIRHAEKANRAAAGGAPRPSRSSRPSAFDDFSGMGDSLNNEDDYRNHSSGSSRYGSKRGKSSSCTNRSPGWEDPMFDEFFTEEPRSFRTNSYYDDEEGIPRSQRRRERSGSGRSHRGHRSHSNAYDNNYTDTEPPRSSRGTGAHGYYTEERRPGGFSYASYFTSGPETRHQSHSSYSQHRDSRDDRPPPRHSRAPETSGVKPAEDPYVTLGISSSASTSEIKKAHRKLSLENHPDRVAGGSAAKKRATERMAMINQAHDVLKDKEMRAFYDRTGLIASTI